MHLLETIREALSALRANKLRSSLTLLGMVIGVFAVIAAVTAVDVIDLYFKSSIQGLGASTLSVERYDFGGNEEQYHPPLTYRQTMRLKDQMGSAYTVSVEESFDGGVKAQSAREETNPNISLYGTDQFFLGNFGYDMRAGRPFAEQDVQNARPVALLGSSVAEALFPAVSPIGKEVKIGRVRLEVVGVLAEKGGLFRDPNSRVYAPLTYLLGTYGDGGRSMNSIRVRAPSPEALPAAREAVMQHLRTIRAVGAGQPANFNIDTSDGLRSTFAEFTSTLTMGGAAVGLISLLAAGVGIMNIMLVSVTERTKEIGIRKAVGAKWYDILGQFLLEAVILCQVGGLVGILLGGLGGNLTAVWFDIQPAFPWLWAGVAVAGVTLLALVFGGYPAYKAARLDPIDSLRYE